MTQSLDRDDLRVRYERAADAPVATGDRILGKHVLGFCRRPEGDHILVEGDGDVGGSAYRPLPCRGGPPGLERTGPSPVADLPADRLQPAPAGLRAAVEGELDSREDGQFVRGLLEEIAAMKHWAWLVGGTVRDLLAARHDKKVKDFDVTGTIGPGCLDAMITLRRRSGTGDYIPWLSPQNVWSVTSPGQGAPRLVEYKPLARLGFRFPVWGGSLGEDAATRDLTFNALYYDRQSGVLADPCGEGRAHLAAQVMSIPLRDTDPVAQASVILRCIKFRLRDPGIDISQVVMWIKQEVPDDFVSQIPESGWKRLIGMRLRSVLPELGGHDEMIVAGEFGPKAAQLVQEIRARA
jgi:hypothetical protein